MIQRPALTTLVLTISLLFSSAIQADENFRSRAHHENSNTDISEDIDAEIRFGKTIAARILGQFPLYENEKLAHYINLVGKSLALYASRDEIDYHFAVLDADFINAYSAPGGYIFVTKGAIKAMRDESELAAVLAHEIAHITEKHIVKEFKIKGKEKSATSGISQILGSSQSSAQVLFTQAVDNAVNKLMKEGFKQNDEFESDKVALTLLAATGYDPKAMYRYLKRIQKLTIQEEKKSGQKPTHPPTSKRLKTLNRIAKNDGLNKLKLPKGKKRFAKYAIK